jgi:hypothetical protein
LKFGADFVISRLATTFAGIALIVYGAIAALSPLPLGIPLIILGIMMIALANPAARPLVLRMRHKWRWFDKLVITLGARSPAKIKDVIRETEPNGKSHGDEDRENKDSTVTPAAKTPSP